ncbi:AbrB/MazE/SpoVT family DNA-binding domain-containing protein [Rhizobium deserti]|uniref:AbrB/MazE/SpoVT family DNA-binding domain-containing protein n=1 Tax=Rhizobium deserti TaxID=2547961 RepID=A0A4R5UJS3_9HYPH|nr:AbrB/MazE/SpoVT family DNA-binding domain-containing protein [Rhizobium deserti]TDK37128.1 AbrB/MazE/SpoVT family DNA-binding domain-containing protein [Rhizobium deserti]
MGAEHHVKFFRNGKEQAVVIPAEFEMAGEEAIMRKEGDRLVIEPVRKTDLLEWLATIEPWEEEFPDVDEDQPPSEEVDLFPGNGR